MAVCKDVIPIKSTDRKVTDAAIHYLVNVQKNAYFHTIRFA